MSGVSTLSTVRHTLTVNGSVVHTLHGGTQGPPGAIVAGGTTGQLLGKASATENDVEWVDPDDVVAGATHAATIKATPVDADELPLADSAATFALKKLTWANLKAGIFAAWGALVAAGTTKATPVDADSIALSDSAASNATKKLTWANLKATLLASPTVTGLLTIAGQIKFPATQSASSDPNTLDDYEEGTFTPAITFGGAATDVTYSARTGAYTKIGNRVDFKLYVFLSAKGSSTGDVKITGLPFPTSATADTFATASIYVDNLTGVSGAVMALISTSATAVDLRYSGTGTKSNLADTNCTDTSVFVISGTYFV